MENQNQSFNDNKPSQLFFDIAENRETFTFATGEHNRTSPLEIQKLTIYELKEKHGIVAAEVDKAKATIKGMLNALLKTMGTGWVNEWYYHYHKHIDVWATSNGLYQLCVKDITVFEHPNPELIYRHIKTIVKLNKDEFEDEN